MPRWDSLNTGYVLGDGEAIATARDTVTTYRGKDAYMNSFIDIESAGKGFAPILAIDTAVTYTIGAFTAVAGDYTIFCEGIPVEIRTYATLDRILLVLLCTGRSIATFSKAVSSGACSGNA